MKFRWPWISEPPKLHGTCSCGSSWSREPDNMGVKVKNVVVNGKTTTVKYPEHKKETYRNNLVVVNTEDTLKSHEERLNELESNNLRYFKLYIVLIFLIVLVSLLTNLFDRWRLM